jgi:pyruvate dehydrogenase E2 component (dihydrolipoamide acetyltransferase)
MSDIQAIVMPKWGLAMEEGALTAWLVQDGSQIEKGQEIAEIETSKIANVFESPGSGTLRRLVAKPGDVLPVGALLAVLAPAAVPDAEIDGFVAGFVVQTPKDDAAGGIAERKMERDGRNVVFKAAGTQSDATPVVLIHGFGGDSDNWLFNIEEIAKSHPVYALDLPGHGKSTKSLMDGGLGELSTSVVDLLDEIGVAKAHLVGHSLGAAEKRKEVKATLQLLFADPELVSAQMIEGVQRFKRLEGAKEALRTIAERNLPSGKQASDFRALASENRVPLLIIWGERDAILDPAAAKTLPSSVQVVVVEGAGHMPHMEAASVVNEKLPQHFDAVDRQ